MTAIYYAQTNLICILLMLLVFFQIRKRPSKGESSSIIFQLLISWEIILCFTDAVAGIVRGQTFSGARAIIQASNILYFVAGLLVSYLWFIYVNIRLESFRKFNGFVKFLTSVPILIFEIICITNPFTSFVFSIDSHNCYVRGAGVYIHWILNWLYILTATVQVIISIYKDHSRFRKNNKIMFIFFIIPPAIASVLQIVVYGITVSQVGIMLSILIIYLQQQQNLVLKDELTGINNKRALHNYIDYRISHNETENVTLAMLDLNHFKKINDSYGHLEGDNALRTAAANLTNAIAKTKEKFGLYRYGGDEFLIFCSNISGEKIEKLQVLIDEQFEISNMSINRPYELDISMGIASGVCLSYGDYENLIRTADMNMYRDKEFKREKENSD